MLCVTTHTHSLGIPAVKISSLDRDLADARIEANKNLSLAKALAEAQTSLAAVQLERGDLAENFRITQESLKAGVDKVTTTSYGQLPLASLKPSCTPLLHSLPQSAALEAKLKASQVEKDGLTMKLSELDGTVQTLNFEASQAAEKVRIHITRSCNKLIAILAGSSSGFKISSLTRELADAQTQANENMSLEKALAEEQKSMAALQIEHSDLAERLRITQGALEAGVATV